MAENNSGNGPGRVGGFGRRLLVAVDAKGYGGADAVTQGEFQEAIGRLVDAAAGAAGLDRSRWLTQKGGDSLFAVLPEGADEPALVGTFMRALDARLHAFNRNRRPHARLRLRAAVHFGTASPGANGFVGRAPVEIGRILDSAPLRAALAGAPDACLAVGVSGTVFRDVVQEGYATLRADEFRHVRVEEKEFRGEAWIWVPGGGVRPSEAAPGESVPEESVPEESVPEESEKKVPDEGVPGDALPGGRPGAGGEEAAREAQGTSVYTMHVSSGGAGAQGPGAHATVHHHNGGRP